ncbi:MAG: S-layer homology domain-containing protein [Peptococcaceae bacterium]|nr:S-layer homology domain-containing protein [Peptococcaceae bacterium]
MMKRKLLATVLTLSMLMGIMPVSASAQDTAILYAGGEQLTGSMSNPVYAKTVNGAVTTQGASESDYNIKWDGTTLILKNAEISSGLHENAAIYYSEGDLAIVLEGSNVVTASSVTVPNGKSKVGYGIYGSQDINISGTGSLDVTGSKMQGNFGGSAYSYGIRAEKILTISGGTVVASGGTVTIQNSMFNASVGLYAVNQVIISGGTVTATGGQAPAQSYGIWASNKNVSISGGEVTASADSSAAVRSCGIWADGGTVIVAPQEAQVISVAVGAAAPGSIIEGSPFDTEKEIETLIDNAIYFHSIATSKSQTYHLTAILNGGDGMTVSGDYAVGAEIQIDAGLKNGYRFSGWTSSGGGIFADDSSASTTFIMPAADTTITATWTEETYNVKLNTNGGTVNSGDVTSYTYGTGATLPTDVTRTGYTFDGWYDNAAFSGAPVTGITTTDFGDKTYYAKWTANTYKVTLNTNNGTINSGNVTGYTYGTETTLPTDVTRAGYTFAGWYEDEALSGEPETVIPADAMGDKEYWAKWTAKSYPSAPPTVSEKIIAAINAADPGETVTVDLSSGSTKLDKEVFEALAGKDVTLVVDLGDGVSWTVNGSDISEDADFTDIDLSVTMGSDGIPVDVVDAITGERDSVQLTLAHDGAFGFTMTLTAPLGAENAGYWANLYHFNEEANAMTFETAAPIGSDGSVSLSLSHASQYVLVIDDHNHGIVTLPFTDVSEGDWFYDPVCYVYSQGLMTGTSATTFEPNTPLSRAMLVAVLHRLEGSPQASGSDFTDVADGDWYAQAVNWAASVGVVNGFDDGTFQPNAAITREQMAAILRNYAAYKGLDVTASGDIAHYSDAASVSTWAKESVTWAVDQGLISGITIDTLQPQGLSTRAQVAAVLQRYLEN